MTHALIVDDNRSNIDALTALLQREGVDCTSVVSPHQLYAALQGINPVDVVFLDLEFPNDSGFDLLAELREQAVLQGAPIIAYTVHTSEVVVAQDAGFDGFIGKPLSVQLFPQQLRSILSGEPVWYVPE
ncbi:MAG: response regulator [Chloroflexi bacterium]|nr:response regulator [Chloroflexota bacterium]